MFYHKTIILEFNGNPLPLGLRISNGPPSRANDNKVGGRPTVERRFTSRLESFTHYMRPLIILNVNTGNEERYESVTEAIKEFSGTVSRALNGKSGGPTGRMCRNYWCRYEGEPAPTPDEIRAAQSWYRANKFRFKVRA